MQVRWAIVALVSLFVAAIAGWGMSSGEPAETRSDHAPTYEPVPTPSPVEVAHQERSVSPVVYSDPGFDFEEEPPPVLHEDEIEWADDQEHPFANLDDNAGKPWLSLEDMHQRFDLLVERVGVEPDTLECEEEEIICEIGWDILDVPLDILHDAAHDTLTDVGSLATVPLGEGSFVVVTRAPPTKLDFGRSLLHINARKEAYNNRPVEGIREVDP